jgi:uncharacterized protein
MLADEQRPVCGADLVAFETELNLGTAETAALLGLAERTVRFYRRRIIWLNPLIGWQGYTPQARGMQAALPFVDLFAPAHNLASLAALEPYLARIR